MTIPSTGLHVRTVIHIARPVAQVFEFATTPVHWPRWHPGSLKVSGATDHSLAEGEQITEEFRVGERAGRAVWTVREREAPHRWVIDGVQADGSQATITYTLTPEADGTEFERTAVIRKLPPEFPERFLAELYRQLEAESLQALRGLKAALEL
jgi:uncharacterized protein YndB with AHSA1/START domain